MEYLIHFAFAILAVLIWELRLRTLCVRLKEYVSNRRLWRSILDFDGPLYISRGALVADGRHFGRDCDILVEQAIRQRLPHTKSVISNDPAIVLTEPQANLIAIGSPRYTKYATLLQECYELPHEYVYRQNSADVATAVLEIVSSDGVEYVSSSDLRTTDTEHVDYGLLFFASSASGKRLTWISGIHGSGTLGVWKYLAEHAEDFPEMVGRANVACQWLFRIHYKSQPPDSLEAITRVERVVGPMACQVRAPLRPIKAILCDFGNVLMSFDRDRTYRAIGHLYSRPYRDVERAIDASGLRERFELGQLQAHEVHAQILKLFNDDRPLMTFEMFTEWWGDIFWPNQNMIQTLSTIRKRENRPRLILVSNTNATHFDMVREHYPDVMALFDDHILSYVERVAKPHRAIFQKALQIAGCQVHPDECLFVDDNPNHVDVARRMGMQAVAYYNHPQLVRGLRRAGVYVP